MAQMGTTRGRDRHLMTLMQPWPELAAAAPLELSRRDPVLGAAIETLGPCTLTPDSQHFALLVRIIISQQISTKAARSVSERLRSLLPGKRITPKGLSRLSIDDLRSAGLTRARATYIQHLADAVVKKQVRLETLAQASDAEILAQLTRLHGIGRWSVEMLLIFGLGRPDVFPENDLGVRKAIGDLYGHAPLPPPALCRQIAESWRPYRTFATWYLWRHADRTNAGQGLSGYPV
jgi:DNA-3-methyladenine glycosylase II